MSLGNCLSHPCLQARKTLARMMFLCAPRELSLFSLVVLSRGPNLQPFYFYLGAVVFVLSYSNLRTCMYVYAQVQCMRMSTCSTACMCVSDLVLSFYHGHPADPTHVIKRGGWWPAEWSYQPSRSTFSFSFLPQNRSRDCEGTWHQVFSSPAPLTSPAFLTENSRTVPDPDHARDIASMWLQPDKRKRGWTNFGECSAVLSKNAAFILMHTHTHTRTQFLNDKSSCWPTWHLTHKLYKLRDEAAWGHSIKHKHTFKSKHSTKSGPDQNHPFWTLEWLISKWCELIQIIVIQPWSLYSPSHFTLIGI